MLLFRVSDDLRRPFCPSDCARSAILFFSRRLYNVIAYNTIQRTVVTKHFELSSTRLENDGLSFYFIFFPSLLVKLTTIRHKGLRLFVRTKHKFTVRVSSGPKRLDVDLPRTGLSPLARDTEKSSRGLPPNGRWPRASAVAPWTHSEAV